MASTPSAMPARATHGRASELSTPRARSVPRPRARSRPPIVRARSRASADSAASPIHGRVISVGATSAVQPIPTLPRATTWASRRGTDEVMELTVAGTTRTSAPGSPPTRSRRRSRVASGWPTTRSSAPLRRAASRPIGCPIRAEWCRLVLGKHFDIVNAPTAGVRGRLATKPSTCTPRRISPSELRRGVDLAVLRRARERRRDQWEAVDAKVEAKICQASRLLATSDSRLCCIDRLSGASWPASVRLALQTASASSSNAAARVIPGRASIPSS